MDPRDEEEEPGGAWFPVPNQSTYDKYSQGQSLRIDVYGIRSNSSCRTITAPDIKDTAYTAFGFMAATASNPRVVHPSAAWR